MRGHRPKAWIGYVFTKKDGVKVPSKFLYIQFYAGDEQKRINTKTNEGDNRRYTACTARLSPVGIPQSN